MNKTMQNKGLTLSMIFEAESANYGEGIGNITVLKKMSMGGNMFTYISRQAIRYNIVQQLGWDNTPVEGKSGVVQFAPKATIKDYPEIDLFGYMKTDTGKKEDNSKGSASTRSAVARLSNAISLEPYNSDLDFLTNMGLSSRGENLDNSIAQSEIHRSFYAYTITIDLDKVGIDKNVSIENTEKSKRVCDLLDTIQFLYRDIKGRRENFSPVFAIGGIYDRKNPFFEGRLSLLKKVLNIDMIKVIINSNEDTKKNTKVGYLCGCFANDTKIINELGATDINTMFSSLKKEVDGFYA